MEKYSLAIIWKRAGTSGSLCVFKLLSISEKPSKSIFPLIYELQCISELAHPVAREFKFLTSPSPETILQTAGSWG